MNCSKIFIILYCVTFVASTVCSDKKENKGIPKCCTLQYNRDRQDPVMNLWYLSGERPFCDHCSQYENLGQTKKEVRNRRRKLELIREILSSEKSNTPFTQEQQALANLLFEKAAAANEMPQSENE